VHLAPPKRTAAPEMHLDLFPEDEIGASVRTGRIPVREAFLLQAFPRPLRLEQG